LSTACETLIAAEQFTIFSFAQLKRGFKDDFFAVLQHLPLLRGLQSLHRKGASTESIGLTCKAVVMRVEEPAVFVSTNL